MSDFVAECRREWKRLRVPDAVADEMAAELAVDLAEAEADGVSAEEVLGAGALDPRSFAASWAAERGVIATWPKRRLLVAVIAVLSVAALAAGAAILATPSTTKSALASPDSTARMFDVTLDSSTTPLLQVWDVRSWDPAAGRRGAQDVTLPPLPNGTIAPASEPDTNTDAIAWALLIAGIAGLVLTSLYWFGRLRPTATA